MLRKVLFIILFLLTSFVYSKEIVLKSKKVVCAGCIVDDSLILKINPDTKDCSISFSGKIVLFKRNKVENIIDSENQIYQSSWIDNETIYVTVQMTDDGEIVCYEIFIEGEKLFVEF